MDQQTRRRILEKAESVGDAVTLLAEKRDSLSFEEYTERREARDVVEREFQTAIEACLDIGRMVLESRDCEIPGTNAAVFRTLGDVEVLTDDVATRMAQAAGFRNVLTHQYGNGIDVRDVYNVLQHDLPIFREFLVQIRDTLD
jgi:uncharacterized protein YutE (UPF0331/DUF86 family)